MIFARLILGLGETPEQKEAYLDALNIRKAVFIDGQGVPAELEMDGQDETAIHLVLYDVNDDTHEKKAVANGRLIFRDDMLFLTRIAVLPEERGKGYGGFVVRLMIRQAFDGGWEKQYIHSQKDVVPFYLKLGFEALGEEFYEAGIPHLNMVHNGDVGCCCEE